MYSIFVLYEYVLVCKLTTYDFTTKLMYKYTIVS